VKLEIGIGLINNRVNAFGQISRGVEHWHDYRNVYHIAVHGKLIRHIVVFKFFGSTWRFELRRDLAHLV
jgi:hypothetical protein